MFLKLLYLEAFMDTKVKVLAVFFLLIMTNIFWACTTNRSHEYSQGMAWVIVNGNIVGENNLHTGELTGMILYGPGTDFGDNQ